MIDGSDGETSCCSCSIGGGGGDGRIGLVIRINEIRVWESKDWSSSHDDCDGNGINFDDQDDEDASGRQRLLLLYLSIGGGWKMS